MFCALENFNLRPSTKSFQFAVSTYKSLDTIYVPRSTSIKISNIYIKPDFVVADVPALLGLNVLDLHFLTADTVMNRIVKTLFLRKLMVRSIQMKNEVFN